MNSTAPTMPVPEVVWQPRQRGAEVLTARRVGDVRATRSPLVFRVEDVPAFNATHFMQLRGRYRHLPLVAAPASMTRLLGKHGRSKAACYRDTESDARGTPRYICAARDRRSPGVSRMHIRPHPFYGTVHRP
jgi:hypothetical protein